MERAVPIFLLTGTPGSGKSSVAKALLRRYSFGIHILVDDLREWVVSGIAHPVPVWTDETGRQFRLARQAAVATAARYAAAGFAVAIDDVIFLAEAHLLVRDALPDYTVHCVLLQPTLEVALERNAQRSNKAFDTAMLEATICDLHPRFDPAHYAAEGWIVIDSSTLSLDATVDAILRQAVLG